MSYGYNKKSTTYAKQLRKNMTPEEKTLWYRFLKLLPYNVYRQKSIGIYIVDFYCPKTKTVIELDGSQHYEEKGVEKDTIRDAYLKDIGITVLRYTNTDIKTNFDGVCSDIKRRFGIAEE